MAVIFLTTEGYDFVGPGSCLMSDETQLQPEHVEPNIDQYVETTLEEVKEIVAICAGALAVEAA